MICHDYSKPSGDCETLIFRWRLLNDGRIIFLAGRRWKLLDVDEYCIDGMMAFDNKGNLPDFSERYSTDPWPQGEQVVVFCPKLAEKQSVSGVSKSLLLSYILTIQ